MKKRVNNPKEKIIPQIWNIRSFDISTWSLLVSNLITIIIAIIDKWDFKTLFWVYFIQTIIIGIFIFLRLFVYENYKKEFSKSRVEVQGKKINYPVTKKRVRWIIAGIFILGYFGAHLIQYFLINIFIIGWSLDFEILKRIFIPVLILFINHFFSFIYYYFKSKNSKKKFEEELTGAFGRLFGIHFIIIFANLFVAITLASNLPIDILFFGIVKTIVDIKIHQSQHKKEQNSYRK